MTYKIEKNIPAPGGRGRPQNPLTAAVEKMEVKDSVLVTDQPFTCARSVVTRVTKRTGRTFRTQTMDGGVRIWRVS